MVHVSLMFMSVWREFPSAPSLTIYNIYIHTYIYNLIEEVVTIPTEYVDADVSK
jgi:hypothetical protein